MESTMTAIEMAGTIDEQRQLHLDNPLPITGPTRVRVLILYPDNDEWLETEWLRAAAANSVFDFLGDSEEDIYSLSDGKPFNDEI